MVASLYIPQYYHAQGCIGSDNTTTNIEMLTEASSIKDNRHQNTLCEVSCEFEFCKYFTALFMDLTELVVNTRDMLKDIC